MIDEKIRRRLQRWCMKEQRVTYFVKTEQELRAIVGACNACGFKGDKGSDPESHILDWKRYPWIIVDGQYSVSVSQVRHFGWNQSSYDHKVVDISGLFQFITTYNSVSNKFILHPLKGDHKEVNLNYSQGIASIGCCSYPMDDILKLADQIREDRTKS